MLNCVAHRIPSPGVKSSEKRSLRMIFLPKLRPPPFFYFGSGILTPSHHAYMRRRLKNSFPFPVFEAPYFIPIWRQEELFQQKTETKYEPDKMNFQSR